MAAGLTFLVMRQVMPMAAGLASGLALSTFGAVMSPELPLLRRQHEMITTMVSVTIRCVY